MPSLSRPFVARSTAEEHRASTPLELFFDLCFVVAVAQASSRLHHSLTEDHVSHGVLGFTMVFFAIWWAWMNFTWFASAYDNDDTLFRLTVFVQIAGVLILAAGVPRAFDDRDFVIGTLGFLVMRVGLVAQWLRAARNDPEHRATALRYAAGLSACMAGWLALLALPGDWGSFGWLVMVPAELLVPLWAERANPTTWHAGHIVERYGLFTLIVLGESVLAASTAVQAALDSGDHLGSLYATAFGGLLVVGSLWWTYFSQPAEDLMGNARLSFSLRRARESFVWGYGHLVVFASAAAVGAGLAVAADHARGHSALSGRGAALAVAVPVALYLLSVWAVSGRHKPRTHVGPVSTPAAALAVLVLGPLTGSVLVIGLITAATVATFTLAESSS